MKTLLTTERKSYLKFQTRFVAEEWKNVEDLIESDVFVRRRKPRRAGVGMTRQCDTIDSAQAVVTFEGKYWELKINVTAVDT